MSEFSEKEYGSYNIKDIKIKRIQRIHNHFLRVKFTEKMSQLSDNINIGNPNHKLNFLLYGEDPDFPNEVYRILEEGYRNIDVISSKKYILFYHQRNVNRLVYASILL